MAQHTEHERTPLIEPRNSGSQNVEDTTDRSSEANNIVETSSNEFSHVNSYHWSHVALTVLAFFLFAVQGCFGGLLFYSFITYLQYLGKQDHILQLVSYETFNLQLLVPIAIMLLSTMYTGLGYWRRCLKSLWAKNSSHNYTDTDDQIIVPLVFQFSLCHYIRDYKEIKLPSSLYILIGFFLMPVINVALMLLVFEYNKSDAIYLGDLDCLKALKIFRAAELPGVLYYGWFTFQVHTVRMKVQTELKEVAESSLHEEDLGVIKARITGQWLRWKDYRQLTGWWLCFAISIGVLGMAGDMKWVFSDEFDNFQYSEEHDGMKYAGFTPAQLMSLAIMSKTIMLVWHPLFAVGSHSVDHIWVCFQDDFKSIFNKTDEQDRLTKIIEFMKLVCSPGPWVFSTVIFTVLTLFTALSLPPQFVQFWLRPGRSPFPPNTTVYV